MVHPMEVVCARMTSRCEIIKCGLKKKQLRKSMTVVFNFLLKLKTHKNLVMPILLITLVFKYQSFKCQQVTYEDKSLNKKTQLKLMRDLTKLYRVFIVDIGLSRLSTSSQ